jgi:hypothetical protein
MIRPRLLYAFLASFVVITAAGVYQLTSRSAPEPEPAAVAPNESPAPPSTQP